MTTKIFLLLLLQVTLILPFVLQQAPAADVEASPLDALYATKDGFGRVKRFFPWSSAFDRLDFSDFSMKRKKRDIGRAEVEESPLGADNVEVEQDGVEAKRFKRFFPWSSAFDRLDFSDFSMKRKKRDIGRAEVEESPLGADHVELEQDGVETKRFKRFFPWSSAFDRLDFSDFSMKRKKRDIGSAEVVESLLGADHVKLDGVEAKRVKRFFPFSSAFDRLDFSDFSMKKKRSVDRSDYSDFTRQRPILDRLDVFEML